MFLVAWEPLEKEKWQSEKESCHSCTVALPDSTTVLFKIIVSGDISIEVIYCTHIKKHNRFESVIQTHFVLSLPS